MNRHSALSTQLFSMETCNCIQHLMELANKMHNLSIRLRGRDFWLRGMEQRFTYLPAAGNVDNAPLYMTLRTFIDEATAGLEELIGDIDRSLQRRERKGHRKPSIRICTEICVNEASHCTIISVKHSEIFSASPGTSQNGWFLQYKCQMSRPTVATNALFALKILRWLKQ